MSGRGPGGGGGRDRACLVGRSCMELVGFVDEVRVSVFAMPAVNVNRTGSLRHFNQLMCR